MEILKRNGIERDVERAGIGRSRRGLAGAGVWLAVAAVVAVALIVGLQPAQACFFGIPC